MKRRFKDFYGCTASISKTKSGQYRLKISLPHGFVQINKVYPTERGARNVMGRYSEYWEEV
ncbi:hypothetical protein DSECCO2_547320 [anaerobic digester metagenome]